MVSSQGQNELFITPSEFPQRSVLIQNNSLCSKDGIAPTDRRPAKPHVSHTPFWPRPFRPTLLAPPHAPGYGGQPDVSRASTYTLQRLSPRPGRVHPGHWSRCFRPRPSHPDIASTSGYFRPPQAFSACSLLVLISPSQVVLDCRPGSFSTPFLLSAFRCSSRFCPRFGATLPCIFAERPGLRPSTHSESAQT